MVFQRNLLSPDLPYDGGSRVPQNHRYSSTRLYMMSPEDGDLQIKVEVKLGNACYYEFRCIVEKER
jgi:hypothetical protein